MKFEALVEHIANVDGKDAGLDMIKKVNQTIEKYNLLEKGERVVVALSGGPDSTALLVVLAPIAKEIGFKFDSCSFQPWIAGRGIRRRRKIFPRFVRKNGIGFRFRKNGSENRGKKGFTGRLLSAAKI